MTTTFDPWMLRLSYDISTLVINFINPSWVPYYISVGLFEAPDISSFSFLEQMKMLSIKFNLKNKYVKDERVNLNSFTIALTSIVSCEFLHLFQPFVSFCFGHALSTTCQYATNEVKVDAIMNEVILKDAQATFHKTLLRLKSLKWANLSGKRLAMRLTCKHRKPKSLMKICFSSKVIMFQ
jgi:hypothetical protein